MANLLANVVAQQNPQLAGLLGRVAPTAQPLMQSPLQRQQPAPRMNPIAQAPPPPVTAPAGQPGRQGLLSRIGGGAQTLFTGQDDPNLSEDENKRIRREALLQAGLATLAASTSQTGVPAIGQIIAAGAVAGREAAMQGQGTARERIAEAEAAELKRQRQIVWDGMKFDDPMARLESGLRLAELGDYQGATSLLAFSTALTPLEADTQARLVSQQVWEEIGDPNSIDSMMAASVRFAQSGMESQAEFWRNSAESLATLQEDGITWRDVGNAWVPVGRDGRIIEDLQPLPKHASPDTLASIANSNRQARALQAPREYFDRETGTVRLGAWDPNTNTFRPVEGADPVPAAGAGGARGNDFRVQMLSNMVSEPIETLMNAKVPGRGEQILTDFGIRELTSPEMQRQQAAADAVASVYTFLLSGVTAREEEVQRARGLFQPLPGATPEYQEWQRRNLQMFKDLLEDPSRWHPNAQAAQAVGGATGANPADALIFGGGAP